MKTGVKTNTVPYVRHREFGPALITLPAWPSRASLRMHWEFVQHLQK